MCDIVLFVFNIVIIVTLFVCGQHWIFNIVIVMCDCALYILRKLRLCVCHHCCCLLIIYYYLKLTNGSMNKWWMVIWCNGEIKNRTGHFFSHKYWICLFVLFLNTTFLMLFRNKQNLIRCYNTSFFYVIFRNGKNEKLC